MTPKQTVAARREPDRRQYRERVMALRDALAALDGHGFHDTAHDRVRRLLACHECGHQPEQHRYDGGGECTERVFTGHGALLPCPCAEWEMSAPAHPAEAADPSATTREQA